MQAVSKSGLKQGSKPFRYFSHTLPFERYHILWGPNFLSGSMSTGKPEACTFMIGSTEQLWGAGAAIGLREGQAAGVLGVIAGRAEGRRQIRVVGVTVAVVPNCVPALTCPPHVICDFSHKFSHANRGFLCEARSHACLAAHCSICLESWILTCR